MCGEQGALYQDSDFTDLFLTRGQPESIYFVVIRKIMKLKIFIISFFFVISLAAKSSAQESRYVCPEGTIGSNAYGGFECKLVDSQDSSSDKTAALVALSATTGDIFHTRNNPNNSTLVNGEWRYFGSQANESCSTMYFRQGVLVSLVATGGKKDLAYLVFISSDIPKPEKPVNLRVTLSQTNQPPATVRVVNATYIFNSSEGNNVKYGAIIFSVPALEAAINGMEETQKFNISIEGRTLAEIEWNGGLAARNKFSQCVENPNKWTASTLPPNQSTPNNPPKVSAQDKQAAVSFTQLGEQAMKNGNYDSAIQYLSKAIQSDPNYSPAYFYIGYIFADVGEYDRAIESYNLAIQLNPNDDSSFFNRALIYFEQKAKFELAEADFSKVIQIDPQNAKAYFYRGNLYESWGKDDQANADRKKWKSLGGDALPDFEGVRKTLFPPAEFDKNLAAQALKEGSSTIIGKGCAIYDGRRFEASYVRVILYPVTPYFEKWYQLREKKEDKSTNVFINREASKYAIATQTNGDGKFVFSRLKPGKYFVQMLFNFQQIKTEKVYEGSDYDTDYYSLRDYYVPRESRLEKFIEIKNDGDTEKVTLKNRFSIIGC